MEKNRKDRGFSLAEMLIVVAIISVLMGVAFVAVQNHQRSMTRLEFDTIAKEIFVAAQNHLTAAESQGYLENTAYGHEETTPQGDDNPADVFYVVSGESNSVKELMLPNYALDATVLSGSFIIRYQPSSATVLDVFYSKEGKGTFLTVSGVTLGAGDYNTLMGETYRQGGEKKREEYRGGVIGWYGGAEPLPQGERLEAPTFEVINKEKLLVKVSLPSTAPVDGYCVKLIVTGKTSGTEAYFSLMKNGGKGSGPRLSTDENNTIVLDCITESNQHFSQIDPNFFPGEDLSIKAVAYSTGVLANVAMSAEKTTNSIFADPYAYAAGKEVLGSDVENGVAAIANIRHLENMDPAISGYVPSNVKKTSGPNQGIQLRDLSWIEFKTNSHGEDTVICGQTGSPTKSGCYYPVSPNTTYTLDYDGNNHKITEVKVDYSADAGVFGTLNGGSVSNLLVLDPDIVTSSGAAGGLIGSMTETTVERCAANGTVRSSGAAGGLIGKATSGTVTACYSGGHTDGTYASYYTDGTVTYGLDGKPTNGIYNINAGDTGTAGGLIGISTDTDINYSYSTCSAKGATAGGLVGNAAGTIKYSYATGLVSGTTEGAFAGSFSGTATDCHYYEIINERKDDKEAFIHLDPVQGKETFEGVAALDASAQTYNDFSLPKDKDSEYKWQPAVPNDAALKTYYIVEGDSVYNLRTVAQLGATLDKDTDGNVISIVAIHYGDWPAPEIFIINE